MAIAKADTTSDTPSADVSAWPSKAWRDRLEWAALVLLAICFLASLVVRSDALPMHIWDESRNANNALEAARDGHWLAPAYGGGVDHWNTKPPLLIWLIASGLSAGLPPLWALRLPSILAAAATLCVIWSALRLGLRDRLAAVIGAGLVLASPLYLGVHGARTGDYDSLETLFVVGYVLSFWRILREPGRTAWFAAFAACVVGAVMTKGIAGLMPAPGLILALAVNRTRALQLIRDWRAWVFCAAALALCLGYYAAREVYDPGYVAAVLGNEVGGRFMRAHADRSANDLLFYLNNAIGFEPALLLAQFGLLGLSRLRARAEARDLAVAALGAAACLLVVISLSRTKLTWYALPLVPLLALPSALGASAWLRVAVARASGAMRIAAAAACALLVGVLPAAQAARSFSLPDGYRPGGAMPLGASQLFYGRAISALRRDGFSRPVAILDSGFPNPEVADPTYNPVVDFYLKLDAPKRQFSRLRSPQYLSAGATVLTCDPKSYRQLAADYLLSVRTLEGCALATVTGKRG